MSTRPSRLSRPLATLSLIVTCSAILLPPPAANAVDGPSAHREPASTLRATGYYLALGDSLAAGYQPDRGEDRTGGYVDTVLETLQAQRPGTRLVNLACPGESTATMIDGSRCASAYDEGSQLAGAVQLLHAHARRTRLVTVSLGSNDVTPCLREQDISGCAERRLGEVHQNLTTILAAVHRTAPDVPVVVTNYYNPYLALSFDPVRQALVPLTTALQQQLNDTIAAATSAGTAGAGEVADVAAAFRSYDTSTTATGLPVNVATICAYTWMCSWTPPNIHPTDPGYDAIAEAVIDDL